MLQEARHLFSPCIAQEEQLLIGVQSLSDVRDLENSLTSVRASWEVDLNLKAARLALAVKRVLYLYNHEY